MQPFGLDSKAIMQINVCLKRQHVQEYFFLNPFFEADYNF